MDTQEHKKLTIIQVKALDINPLISGFQKILLVI